VWTTIRPVCLSHSSRRPAWARRRRAEPGRHRGASLCRPKPRASRASDPRPGPSGVSPGCGARPRPMRQPRPPCTRGRMGGARGPIAASAFPSAPACRRRPVTPCARSAAHGQAWHGPSQADPSSHRAAPRGQRGARLPAATRGLALAPQASRPLVRGVGLRGIHAPGAQAAARLPSEGAARPLNGGPLLRGRRGGQAGIHQLRPTRQRARQLPAHGLAGGGPQDLGRRRRDHRGGAWCGA